MLNEFTVEISLKIVSYLNQDDIALQHGHYTSDPCWPKAATFLNAANS